MEDKIVRNITYSVVEKTCLIGAQLLSSIILIRCLTREEFGVIGIVAGYMAFLNFFNISFENAIIRDHKRNSGDLAGFVGNFLCLAFIKGAFFLLCTAGLAAYFVLAFDRPEFVYAVASAFVVLVADMLAAPYHVLASIKFNQKLVAKVVLLRSLLNLALLGGLVAFPKLEYLVIKDLIVAFAYVGTWAWCANRLYGVDFFPRRGLKAIDTGFLKRAFKEYLAWMHLSGVASGLMAKADLFFLSFFVDLRTAGNYNIALSAANIASVPPQILSYQHGIALSHAGSSDRERKLTWKFLAASMIVCALVFACFAALGGIYVRILSGAFHPDISGYMLWIAGGLLLARSMVGPVISYVNMRGSTRSLFAEVMLPTLVITILLYWLGAAGFGAGGVAVANVIAAAAWLLITMWHGIVRYPRIFAPPSMASMAAGIRSKGAGA